MKYCSQCGHHIHNLSLLNAAERAALLARAQNERICGTYYVRLSGELVTPEAPLTARERSNAKQFGAAILSAAAMAIASGCVATPQATDSAATQTPIADHNLAAATDAKDAQLKSKDCSTSSKDDEVIMLTGFYVTPSPPQHVPGHVGK